MFVDRAARTGALQVIGNIRLPAQLEGQPFDVVADVEGLIYWQYVNVGIVPVSQYD